MRKEYDFSEGEVGKFARQAELAIIARAEPPVDLRKLYFGDRPDPAGQIPHDVSAHEFAHRLLPRILDLGDAVHLDDFLDHDIALAPTVREYLATRKPFADVGPFAEAEVHALEVSMELYHGVEEPYYIHMSLALQQLGRPWQFEETAGQFLTGFTLGKE